MSPKPPNQRILRVFVSSTFRDMHAEREELVKRVFPELRQLCESRGVTWGEVDLRWGVSDEQKAEGHLLPICLAEIRNCRPYFIGILGERYGWVPDAVSPTLLEQDPWLLEYAGCSVTELEILCVLRNPVAQHAFFYFRDPGYAATLAIEERDFHVETNYPEEIVRWGHTEAERCTDLRRQQLAALKQRIRDSGLPVREPFADARMLGEWVRADLTALIDRRFPASDELSDLDREAAEHDAFTAKRSLVYIERESAYRRLDRHVDADGRPLVVLGESGSGKSALLANWLRRHRAAHPHRFIFAHFLAATENSADWAAMIRRFLGELRRQLGIEIEVPVGPSGLRAALASGLHRAAVHARLVIVIDGLDRLDDFDHAPDLIWLPANLPAGVRLIVSSLPGRSLKALQRRGWPTFEVQMLDARERGELIVLYLGQYSKALDSVRGDRLARAEQTANPLYLRALLEELRLWGDHDTLDDRIEFYLSAANLDDLFGLILARYETDFECDRPGLVRDAMSLLWAARRGLTQAELLDLLGCDGEPLPGAHWSPLYLAAEASLLDCSGLIGFDHDYLRAAVRDRYLRMEEQRRNVHHRLAVYFEHRPPGGRVLDELPWQVARTEDPGALVPVLCDLTLLNHATRATDRRWDLHRKLEWAGYWRTVPSPNLPGCAYQDALDRAVARDSETPETTHLAMTIGDLLMLMGLYSQAEPFVARAARNLYRQRGPGHGAYAEALNSLAQVHKLQGRLREALSEFEQALRLYERSSGGEELTVATILNNLAQVHCTLGCPEHAVGLAEQALQLRERRLGSSDPMVATSLDNLGKILQLCGRHHRARPLHERALAIYESFGGPDQPDVAVCLTNLGHLQHVTGELDKADECYCRALRISSSVLGEEHPFTATILNNLGGLRHSRGDPADAVLYYRRALAITEKNLGPGHPSLARGLDNSAAACADLGDFDEAQTLARRALAIARSALGAGHPDVARYRSRLAVLEQRQH